MLGGLVAGASGLFFLPLLLGTLLPWPLMPLLSRPVLAWDLVFLGAAGHANPLAHSALLPLAATLTLFGARRLRGLVAGFALGCAAYLAVCSLWGTVDVLWMPLQLLEHAWLLGNALLCAVLGLIVLRKGD